MTGEPHDHGTDADTDIDEMSPEELADFKRAVQEALDDTRPTISFEKVREWLLSWGTDHELPPPE
jgi:hypothetical protein